MADILLDGSADRSIEITSGVPSSDGKKLTLKAADAVGPGDHNGGDVEIKPGNKANAGADGRAILGAVAVQKNKALVPGAYLFSNDGSHRISVTADGVGPNRGGTGLNATQSAANPAVSFVALSVNDVQIVFSDDNGFYPSADPEPRYALGGDGSVGGSARQSWLKVWSQCFATRVGAPLASATTLTLTHGIHHVTGTTQVQTITPPFAGFTGDVTLILDENCDFAAGGNIDPYAVEKASLAAVSASSVGGKAKIALTYDGSTWY